MSQVPVVPEWWPLEQHLIARGGGSPLHLVEPGEEHGEDGASHSSFPGWMPNYDSMFAPGSGSPIYTFESQFSPDQAPGLFDGDCSGNGAESAPLPSAAAAATAAAGETNEGERQPHDASNQRTLAEAAPLPPTEAADVDFLKSLDLDGLNAWSGASSTPLRRLLISPATSGAGEAAEGQHPPYDASVQPTPATLVADLKATSNFKSTIADLNDDGSGGPLAYLGYKVGAIDEVHEDENEQYIFCSPREEEECLEGGPVAGDESEHEDAECSDKDNVVRSRAQLTALKQYVLNQRVFFVLIHTKRVVVEHCPEGMSTDVLLMALGVSPATGNLVGVLAIQACHNLCD